MKTAGRLTGYCRQRALRDELAGAGDDGLVMSVDMERLTGPQRRRVRHKAYSRKTHEHGAEPCPVCRPGAPVRAPLNETERFRPYNKPWFQAITSGGRAAGKSSGYAQMPGPPVR